MPTVFVKYGYRFHFYSNERNEPCHIHVTGKGGEMKVWLPSLKIEFAYSLSPPEQRKIMVAIRENIEKIMEEWNEFSSKKN